MDNKNVTLNANTPYEVATETVKILDSMKAFDIKLLHVSEKTVIADYFVIASGKSNTQLKSLSGEVEFKLGEKGVKPGHIEGYSDGNWILMDYASVIVHVFTPETRKYYNLEQLWENAEEIDISEFITEE